MKLGDVRRSASQLAADRPWLARATTWVLALAVLVLAYPCARAVYNYTFATLGRDTGIYQYVAWAITQGQRPYVDIRENNGPLVYLFHLLSLALGGADEQRLRSLDIGFQALAYAFAGYVAAGPWSASDRPSRVVRAVFAALGVVVLCSQYLVFDWWATAQRESTYDAIVIVGLGLQLIAHQRLIAGATPESVLRWLFAAAVIVGSTWFGKPTYVLCSAAQLVVVLADPLTRGARKKMLVCLAGGTAAAVLVFLLWIAIWGDVAAFVRIVLLEAPRYYVPIWKNTLFGTYNLGHNAPLLNQGIATLIGAGVLLLTGLVPRAFMIGLVPLVFGLVTFFAQRKGFYYHLHPVTAGAYWLWLLALGCLRARIADVKRPWLAGVAALVACISFTYQAFGNLVCSDFYAPPWMPAATSPSTRETPEFYAGFHASDFNGYTLRQAAAYLASHTRADQTVQVYGLEPYLLFLAKRRTATPFIFAYDLNMDPALAGGPGGRPSEREAAVIRGLQERNAAELARAMIADPPGAVVLIDGAPMAYVADALVDFREHCPQAAGFLEEAYEETARFGTLRVFLPK